MADAAYWILTQDSRSCTGNFYVDENLLRQQGVTDFDQYAVVPGSKDFMLDFFLDENLPELQRMDSAMGRQQNVDANDVGAVFQRIKSMMSPELLKKVSSVYSFDLQGEKWFLDMKNEPGSAGQGEPPSGKAQCTMKMSKADFHAMFAGKLKPTAAFMAGKLKIQGKLEKFSRD